ncbi:hypothetical protein AURDEDRAFT_125177 [Auricularia subglabra TFB-10046 SS5]|uniref:Uncharacterized protein n=1 Tax=Auricularia subglabra (strain TFB-10046 / SS5) TaxID=717982 RepID=J0DDV9_AURST|nr:hypothetical protein AURDEDRAFT_125177 [Auricularia subglabra TFB-10046 SS5]
MDAAQPKNSQSLTRTPTLTLKRLSSLRRAELEAAQDPAELVRSASGDGRRSRMGHRRRMGSQSSFTGSIVADDETVERRAGATSRLAFHHAIEDEAVEKTVRRVSRLVNLKQSARASSSEVEAEADDEKEETEDEAKQEN